VELSRQQREREWSSGCRNESASPLQWAWDASQKQLVAMNEGWA
jgi:hypothetical protein